MSFCNHDRDDMRITNVLQARAQITGVNTFAERLKTRRNELGFSQAQLAKKAGVSQSTIGMLEKGRRQEPRKLLAIAKALGVRAEWLESGVNPMLVGTSGDLERAGPAVQVNEQSPAWPPTLKHALPVVLDALEGLDNYTADKVIGALRAVIQRQAPREVTERDLLQWLQEAKARAAA